MIDRIDYNIEQTTHNVRQANVKLREADAYQNSPASRRCILILLFLIVVFSIILAVKYSSK
jgi:syntaxin 16